MNDLILVAKINQDIRLGARAGVRGTPTIFVNGRISRARTLEGLQGAVEKEVARIGKGTVVGGKQ
jgi:protein-disulfide isomerase